MVISALTDDLPDLMLIGAEKLSDAITVLFILWYTLTNAEYNKQMFSSTNKSRIFT